MAERAWARRRLERLLPVTLRLRTGSVTSEAVWLDTLHVHLVLAQALAVGRGVDAELTLPHAGRTVALSLQPIEVVPADPALQEPGWLHRTRWHAGVLTDGDWLVSQLPAIRSSGSDGEHSVSVAESSSEPPAASSGGSRHRSRSRSRSRSSSGGSRANRPDDVTFSGGAGAALTALVRIDDAAAFQGRFLLGHQSFRLTLGTSEPLSQGDVLTLVLHLPQGQFIQVPAVVDQVRVGRLVLGATQVSAAQMFDLRQALSMP